MFKIKFKPTGHCFVLPDETAKELKAKFPEDYIILEKNGKKFKDKSFSKKTINEKSILHLVLDE